MGQPKPPMIEALARAKINLTLHVTGKRADGYHLLDSLVVFAEVADRMTFEPADSLELAVSGPFAEGVPTDDRNLVRQVAKHLASEKGARITLEKHLPHGAGIGGGSSDAAAAIHALCALWDLPAPEPDDLLKLGADLPCCLKAPTPVIMQGIGEKLSPVPGLPRFWLVLINPGIAVPTGQVFGLLEGTDNSLMSPLASDQSLDDFVSWLRLQRNDLLPPARQIAPEIAEVLTCLSDQGSAAENMSGSGSTCWGLFESRALAEAAAKNIATARPDWWIKTTRV